MHLPSLSRIAQQPPQHQPLMHTSTTFTVWTSSIPSSPSARRRLSRRLLSRLLHGTSRPSPRPSTLHFPTIPMRSLSRRILAVKSCSRSQRRRTGPNGAGTTSRPLRVHTNDSNARTLRMRAYRSTDSTVHSSSRAVMSSMRHSTSSHHPSPQGKSIRSPLPPVEQRKPNSTPHPSTWRGGTTGPAGALPGSAKSCSRAGRRSHCRS